MQAYMNEEALNQTQKDRQATYFSRSRNKIWVKGEESGHYQYVKEILADCDGTAFCLKLSRLWRRVHTEQLFLLFLPKP